MKIAVVDTETTSLKPAEAEILEVAVATLDLETGQTWMLMDQLIRPVAPEADWATCWFLQNSGLQVGDFARAPKFAEVAPTLQGILDKMPATSYNLYFDRSVLQKHGIHIRVALPCLMLTCQNILKLPGRYGDYKFPSLKESWGHFFPGTPLEGDHRAAADALAGARLAYSLVKQGYLVKLAGKKPSR